MNGESNNMNGFEKHLFQYIKAHQTIPNFFNAYNERDYDGEICPTLLCSVHPSGKNSITVVEKTNSTHKVDRMYGLYDKENKRRQTGGVVNADGLAQTLMASSGGGKQPFIFDKKDNVEYQIRKFTPEECFLLMGMTIEDVQKARAVGINDNALYNQAGNGLVSNCVQLLMEHLYKSEYDSDYVTTDEKILTEQGKYKKPMVARNRALF